MQDVLPKIIDQGAVDTVRELGNYLATSGNALLVGVVLVGLLTGFSIKSLLSEVRNLSMITHFNIMQLNYSPLITSFYGAIFPFINFDLFNVAGKLDELYEAMFPDLNDDPYSEEANSIGYETLWICLNMGSQTLLIFVSAISFLFFYLVEKLTPNDSVA